MLIWILVAFLAFPAHSAQPTNKPIKTHKTTKTLSSFIAEALSKGDVTIFPSILGSFLDLSGDTSVKGFEIDYDETTDDIDHLFYVITTEPKKLILSTHHEWDNNSEGYYYKADLAGNLEKAISAFNKKDSSGEPIRGSGQKSEKDITSPEIKERFKHELDFWLKGAYRKKAGKPAAK